MQRNRLPIIGLIVFGVLALGLTAMSLLGGNKTATPVAPAQTASATPTPAPSTDQVVAQMDIPPRTVITRSMLTVKPTTDGATGGFSSAEQVVGRLASAPISAGEAISGAMVTRPIQRVVPADFEIPQGLRAVAIYVDPAQTAAGLIDKGDRVDVLATFKTTVDKQDTESYTQVYTGLKTYTLGRTVAQDLLVIGVDSSLLAPPPTPTPTPGQATLGGGAPPATPTPTPGAGPTRIRVLLAATPLVAQRLVAANDSGVLHLTVRGPTSREQLPMADSNEYPTRVFNVRKKATPSAPRVREPSFVPSIPNPNPPFRPTEPKIPTAPLPPSGSPVTVIRGTDKTNVNVPISP